MLKGYRGPLLALMMSILLFGAVLATRPTDELPPVVTRVITRTPAPLPTNLPTLTPAPTIPFQDIDTATLHEALVTQDCIIKLNPLLAGYNQADRDVSALIFEGLMTTNEYGAIVPALATGQPTISGDGLTYAIRLRNDVFWQDGIPFTSKDVIFTVRLMQDPVFPGPADLHAFWQTVEVDAIDDYTVRFKLAQPLATFPDYLRVGIVPEHVLQGMTAATLRTHPFNLSPVGTGPYQFDSLIGNGSQRTGVRLKLSPLYLARTGMTDKFAIKQIVFHCLPTFNDAIAAFQRGEVNSISLIPPDSVNQIAALPLMPYSAMQPAFGTVIYNWRSDNVKFFRDIRMRQALSRSVDRVNVITRYLGNHAIPADSPILPNSWAYAAGVSCPAYDPNQPDAAKNSLTLVQAQPEATTAPIVREGEPEPTIDPNATPVPTFDPNAPRVYTFQLLVSDDPSLAAIAGEIVAAWESIGLRVTLIVVDKATFKERLTAGNFDAALVELNLAPSADPDPYSLWRQVPADGGLNFGGMNDRRLSEVIETARRESNGASRVALYQEFQKLFCERAVAMPLYYPVYFYGADERLVGIQLGFMSDPSDRFRTIADWQFRAS